MGSYTNYLVRRLAGVIPLALLTTMIVFVLIQAAPGSPISMFLSETVGGAAMQEKLERQLGLDRPIHLQYLSWLGRVVTGDLGNSFLGRPVSKILLARLPATLELQLMGLILALGVSIPLGILSALRPYSFLDTLATSTAFLGISMPEFWFGFVFQLLLAVKLGLLPSSGRGADLPIVQRIPYFIMPVSVLAIRRMASLTRFTRSSMLDVLSEQYLVTARSKGLNERTVLFKHALKNALIPVVTAIGLSMPAVIGGSVIVEYVFAWPGIGALLIEAVLRKDYPVVLGVVLLTSLVIIIANFIVDCVYAVLDPRIVYD